MTKTEFLDLLRYYFRRANPAQLEEILADYEAHFAEGIERGLSEEEIARELGSPHAIYEMYVNEGMVEEISADDFEKEKSASEKIAGGAGKLAEAATDKAREAWRGIAPQIPEAQLFLLKVLCSACLAVGFLVIAVTGLVLYLLSGTFVPISSMPPLPRISPVTMAGLAGTGGFAGLALCFTGLEIRKFAKRRTSVSEKGA